MESCPTFNLQNKRNSKFNHQLTNKYLAASYQYYCQQCERIINLTDKKSQLQSNEHKNNFLQKNNFEHKTNFEHKNNLKMFYCETCKRDLNNNTNSSHINSTSHIENEVFLE